MERSRGAPCPLCPPKLRPVRHQDTATATSRRWSPSGGHRAMPSLWLGKGSPSPRRQEAAPGCPPVPSDRRSEAAWGPLT